jgi:hypothetical protein
MNLEQYESFITRTISDTQAEFDKAIQQIIVRVSGASLGGSEQYINIATADDIAENMFAESGYNDVIDSFLNASYASAINSTADLLKERLGGTFRFTDESLAILEATKEADLYQFGQITDDLRTRIATGFNAWAKGGITRAELIQEIKDQADIVNNRYIKIQVDTAFSGYNQLANIKLAEDAGFTKFKYIGPYDKLTRQFCKDVLSGVYGDTTKTMDEWNKLNNVPSRSGQPNPVSVYRGGWGCRHNLIPIE